MDLKLTGKTALITGGSSGIGFAIAEQLALEGAAVVLASRNADKLASAVNAINQKSRGQATYVTMDVLDPGSVEKAFREASGRAKIDIVVNNTGGPAAGKVSELPLAAWDAGYQSLLRSVVLLGNLAIPTMAERKWGRILNVTSTTAKELIQNLPISGVFRSGLSAWVKSVAKEVGRSGILVNNLLPGPIRTDRLKELEKKSATFYQTMEHETALGRIGEPDEIGRVAAFLCSGANSFVTGTDVVADGGFSRSY